MNDTTKNNTPPLSMPPAVPSASEANCKVLLEQWGTGKCAIVEPIFSEQVNGAEIKLGLAGVQVTTINMSAPKPIALPTPEEIGCQDVGVTLSSKIGASCDMGEGISDDVLSKVCSVDAMRWNGEIPGNVRDDQQTDISISDSEILAILQEVDAGKVCANPVGESNWHRMYCGIMEFSLSNGWRLGVFNDCMSWDYIEWITAPDGRRVDYMTKDQTTGQLRFARMPSLDWQPDHPERWGDWDVIKEALAADAESKT